MDKVIYKTPIESEKEIRLLHLHIKEYNQGRALAEQAKTQHIKTAETLIKIALKKNIESKKITHLTEENGVYFAYFKDNGASIAKQLNMNVKSLDNHLKRLKKAEIAYSYSNPSDGSIRKKGNRTETLFFINNKFFNLEA